jgi:hypothetical protein
MHGVLGWQVGPVPGTDTTALEGATVFLKPVEHCRIDCLFFFECKKVIGKIQASSIGNLSAKKNKKTVSVKLYFCPRF